MEKIRNLSIRKTIVLYMLINLIICFFAGVMVINAADAMQQQVWRNYIDEEDYNRSQAMDEYVYTVTIPRVPRGLMSKTDIFISETCDFLQTYGSLVIYCLGTILTVILFYHNKVKVPLAELIFASGMISKNTLDFKISYSNGDEFGQLCAEYEKMRHELEKNNRYMWQLIEEEKALRSAIAHDIRAPLSILKGYQEILLETVSEGHIEKADLKDMLQEGMKQIDRMNSFIEAMRKMSGFTERELKYQEQELYSLGEQIQREAEMMAKVGQKVCEVRIAGASQILWIDVEVLMEVVDNLLSNALRYARQVVQIDISANTQELTISVMDDGCGFTESAEKVTEAYYHSNPQDDLKHSGLGMYICRIYCEKHGGRLLLGNRQQGGAVVKAIFKSNYEIVETIGLS